jgi:DNA-binding MurR/RpiR family transcriptional regulator
VEKQEHDLTDITQENYKEIIFGTIEDLAKKI